MESRIVKHLCLKNHPAAVMWTDEMPEGAIHFQEGKLYTSCGITGIGSSWTGC